MYIASELLNQNLKYNQSQKSYFGPWYLLFVLGNNSNTNGQMQISKGSAAQQDH